MNRRFTIVFAGAIRGLARRRGARDPRRARSRQAPARVGQRRSCSTLPTTAPIYAKAADDVTPIASLTKLMTAMVVLDAQPVARRADRDRHGRLRLPEGQPLAAAHGRRRCPRREMLRLALMSSENRAASSLARHYPGGTPAFVAAMNAKATRARHDAHALRRSDRPVGRERVDGERPRACSCSAAARVSADPRIHDDASAFRRSAADGPDARLQQLQRAGQERAVGHPAAEDRLHPRGRQVPRDAGDDRQPADRHRAARFARQVHAPRRRAARQALARDRRDAGPSQCRRRKPAARPSPRRTWPACPRTAASTAKARAPSTLARARPPGAIPAAVSLWNRPRHARRVQAADGTRTAGRKIGTFGDLRPMRYDCSPKEIVHETASIPESRRWLSSRRAPCAARFAARRCAAQPFTIGKVVKTDDEWRKILTPEQFNILRAGGDRAPVHAARSTTRSARARSSAPRARCRCSSRAPSSTAAPAGRASTPSGRWTKTDHALSAHRVPLRALRRPPGPVFDDGRSRPACAMQQRRALKFVRESASYRAAQHASSSSFACARVLAVTRCRQHARELVDARRAASRGVGATASSPRLTTRKCGSANAATCGRCVTHSTCRRVAQRLQQPADGRGDGAADARVDFVEDQRGHVAHFARHDLDRERDARQLAARGDARERTERLLRMARDAELDVLEAVARRRRRAAPARLEAAAGHRELLHRRA